MWSTYTKFELFYMNISKTYLVSLVLIEKQLITLIYVCIFWKNEICINVKTWNNYYLITQCMAQKKKKNTSNNVPVIFICRFPSILIYCEDLLWRYNY